MTTITVVLTEEQEKMLTELAEAAGVDKLADILTLLLDVGHVTGSFYAGVLLALRYKQRAGK